MSKGALIIGSTLAGIQAALDLADSGILVHLVESSPFLGADGATTIPQHLKNARLLELTKHTNVQVWTSTSVSRASANAGRFHVELRQHPRYVDLTKCTACQDCIEVCPVTAPGTDHKAIHLAEGAQPGCAVIEKLGKAPLLQHLSRRHPRPGLHSPDRPGTFPRSAGADPQVYSLPRDLRSDLHPPLRS